MCRGSTSTASRAGWMGGTFNKASTLPSPRSHSQLGQSEMMIVFNHGKPAPNLKRILIRHCYIMRRHRIKGGNLRMPRTQEFGVVMRAPLPLRRDTAMIALLEIGTSVQTRMAVTVNWITLFCITTVSIAANGLLCLALAGMGVCKTGCGTERSLHGIEGDRRAEEEVGMPLTDWMHRDVQIRDGACMMREHLIAWGTMMVGREEITVPAVMTSLRTGEMIEGTVAAPERMDITVSEEQTGTDLRREGAAGLIMKPGTMKQMRRALGGTKRETSVNVTRGNPCQSRQQIGYY